MSATGHLPRAHADDLRVQQREWMAGYATARQHQRWTLVGPAVVVAMRGWPVPVVAIGDWGVVFVLAIWPALLMLVVVEVRRRRRVRRALRRAFADDPRPEPTFWPWLPASTLNCTYAAGDGDRCDGIANGTDRRPRRGSGRAMNTRLPWPLLSGRAFSKSPSLRSKSLRGMVTLLATIASTPPASRTETHDERRIKQALPTAAGGGPLLRT